jgi:hypothetical protein
MLIPLVLNFGCSWWSSLQAERDKNLQARHAAALLEGYEAYKTLLSDADTEVVWFEYGLPTKVDPVTAAARIATGIIESDHCFQTMESTPDEARLRCADRKGSGFQEYLIGVLPKERKVMVMYASISGPDESRTYPVTMRSFKKELLGRQGR